MPEHLTLTALQVKCEETANGWKWKKDFDCHRGFICQDANCKQIGHPPDAQAFTTQD
jgi:hypothetical protein